MGKIQIYSKKKLTKMKARKKEGQCHLRRLRELKKKASRRDTKKNKQKSQNSHSWWGYKLAPGIGFQQKLVHTRYCTHELMSVRAPLVPLGL